LKLITLGSAIRQSPQRIRIGSRPKSTRVSLGQDYCKSWFSRFRKVLASFSANQVKTVRLIFSSVRLEGMDSGKWHGSERNAMPLASTACVARSPESANLIVLSSPIRTHLRDLNGEQRTDRFIIFGSLSKAVLCPAGSLSPCPSTLRPGRQKLMIRISAFHLSSCVTS